MNDVASKKSHITLLVGLLITLLITGSIILLGCAQTNLQELQNRIPEEEYAQTNLQELQNRVAELEKKLTDAKTRQEKAYSVQMKLKEQEKKLAGLAESDKYKVQIVEIRADIKIIRTKIEAINKEKNDLEENLRLARNFLSEVRATKPELPPSVKPITTDTEPKRGWLIVNIKIGKHFSDAERNEIANNFNGGRQINQNDLLKGAYQIYNRVGVSLRFIISPKSDNTADLEILLNQREDNANPYFTFFPPMTLGQFKSERFKITIAK